MIDSVNQIPNLTPENIAILQKLLTDINNQSSGTLYSESTPTTLDYGKTTVTDDDAGNTSVTFKSGKGNLVTLNSKLTISGQTAGDVLYFDGTNWVRLAKGTASQVLSMKSDATIPEWTTPSTIGKVIAYTGTGANNRTVAHGLGRTPIFIMCYNDTGASGTWSWMTGLTDTKQVENGQNIGACILSADGTNVTLGDRADGPNSNGVSWKMFVI